MGSTIQAYCTECGAETCFAFDGGDWVCQSCGSFNTQGIYNEPGSFYDDWDNR